MHLPDHYLDPLTCAATAVISGAAVTYSLARVRHEPATKVVMAAATSAAVFAAQMINFPIAAGTSGHLLGGALAGVLLGPWAGLLAMTAVLSVQALIFGDGGMLALGANILNMGVIGVAFGALLKKVPGSARGWSLNSPVPGVKSLSGIFAAALAAWLSVVVAALACALEMAASGTATATEVIPAMLGVHALIGLAEALITALALVAVSYVYESFKRHDTSVNQRLAMDCATRTRRVAGALMASVIVLAGIAPLASSLPDGMSRVVDSLHPPGFTGTAPVPSLLSDYAIPGISWPPLAIVLAALLGAGLVYLVTGMSVFSCRRWSFRRA
jgi:cobalt/nickel transport system permease protein